MNDNTTKLTRKEQWRTLKRLLAYLKPLKKTILFASLFLFIATAADLAGPMLLKQIIDSHIVTNNMDIGQISFLIGLFFVCSLTVSLFRYLYTYYFFSIGNKITQVIRLELFSKLQGLGMRYFDKTPAGSIVSRVTNDTDSIQEMLVSVISVVFSSSFMIVSILVTMLIFSPTLTLICVIFIPVSFVVVMLYQKYSTKNYETARSKMSQLNTKLAESISGMSIIQVFNQERRLVKEFEKTNREYFDARMRSLKLDGILLYPIIHLLTSLTLAAVLLYAGIQSFSTVVTAGLILIFVDYVYKLYEPLFQIMDRLAIYQQAIVSSSRVFTILDHTEEAPQQDIDANETIQDAKIEFKNVSFSYDGKNNVLNDISFTVNPGETVALVGHTGSGKSSIINVMMRFYEFYEGDILIDGKSIRRYPMHHLRDKMSLVLQEPFIYYGTIFDNVRLLNPLITDDAVIKACQFVQADSFVQALPDQYNHQVAERGASFSTGQKQLLAFARTIVTEPKILILDEATANIDTETESLIQEGLERIRKGRTTIAIAHRLSTIKDANQILVLDHGTIIERGTHDELIALGGAYYTMYQLQKQEME